MILCCGEALIDMLPRETTQGEKGFAPYAGGAIFNTAIALGRLGVPTAFFTGLADDMLGDILRETLKASNVDFSPCAIVSRPTHDRLRQARQRPGDLRLLRRRHGRPDDHRQPICQSLGDDCEALHFGAISLIPEPLRRDLRGAARHANAARASSRSTPTSAPASSRTSRPTWRASSAWPPSRTS